MRRCVCAHAVHDTMPASISPLLLYATVDCATPPSEQLGRFWADSLVHDPTALDLIVKTFGACMCTCMCVCEEASARPGRLSVSRSQVRTLCARWGTLPPNTHAFTSATTHAISHAGRDRVCLGTDYPFPLGEMGAGGRHYSAGTLVRGMAWDEDLRRDVLGGNALAWMGKTLEDFLR